MSVYQKRFTKLFLILAIVTLSPMQNLFDINQPAPLYPESVYAGPGGVKRAPVLGGTVRSASLAQGGCDTEIGTPRYSLADHFVVGNYTHISWWQLIEGKWVGWYTQIPNWKFNRYGSGNAAYEDAVLDCSVIWSHTSLSAIGFGTATAVTKNEQTISGNRLIQVLGLQRPGACKTVARHVNLLGGDRIDWPQNPKSGWFCPGY